LFLRWSIQRISPLHLLSHPFKTRYLLICRSCLRSKTRLKFLLSLPNGFVIGSTHQVPI
jgi:rhodanese-related sulfurtransferase